MNRFALCLTAAIAIAVPGTSVAETAAELPGAVAAFQRVCLAGGVDPAAPAAKLAAAGGVKDADVTIDVPALAISRTISKNYDFSKPTAVEQWSGTVDGHVAKFVIASFPEKRRYPHLCALVIDNAAASALPYADDVKAAFKAFGIGTKSTNLVHYFEYAGKVGVDNHPVRGEIFTRSQASGAEKSMHIYVAY
ncbi:hypothetical protein [Sphingobium sp. WCS2017Hpa-17]|uniref:hypothetical protein n=1 Tax=Sphingobium sp. WCS2017Hpa-17 TaxID=3073638 RepID=UPI002889660B|nr:hypothetical protein [Sphingobium sp. WCS2017Hpa-17]